MKGNENTLKKRTVISIATAVVLLAIAGTSIGIFLSNRINTEAAEGNETDERLPARPQQPPRIHQPEDTVGVRRAGTGSEGTGATVRIEN